MKQYWIISILLTLIIIALVTFGYFKNNEFQKQTTDFQNKMNKRISMLCDKNLSLN